jgi:hypothetical protein
LPIIFADDTSVIISSKNLGDFCIYQTKFFINANKLSLNLDKTNVIKFIIKNLPQYPLNIGCNNKYIEEAVNTKFLGLRIDNHLNWKTLIDQLVPKLSGVRYAVRSVLHISITNSLKSIIFLTFTL